MCVAYSVLVECTVTHKPSKILSGSIITISYTVVSLTLTEVHAMVASGGIHPWYNIMHAAAQLCHTFHVTHIYIERKYPNMSKGLMKGVCISGRF